MHRRISVNTPTAPLYPGLVLDYTASTDMPWSGWHHRGLGLGCVYVCMCVCVVDKTGRSMHAKTASREEVKPVPLVNKATRTF